MPTKSGVQGLVDYVVTEADTAVAFRSGDVGVLGTPRVVALCEAAAIDALAATLPETKTAVSSRVEIAHLAPVKVGSSVRAVAGLERSEGKRLIFSVLVTDERGLVAVGKVTRVVVDRAQFLDKAR